MSTASDGDWRRTVAGGVLLVIIAPAASMVLANTLGFLLPFYVSGIEREDARDTESTLAFLELAMSWIGLVPVLFTVPLAIGVWKGTPPSALEPRSSASRFRLGLCGLVAVYALILGTRALLRFWPEAEGGFELGWTTVALWWAFVLLGLAYVRRLFVRLDQDGLARRTRLVAAAYVILVVLDVGFYYFMDSVRPEVLDGAAEKSLWTMIPILTRVLLQVVRFLLLAGLLWKLRKVLLGEGSLCTES